VRLRPFLLSLALAAGALWPVAGTAPAACAGEAPRAALVVDTGDAVLNFCVALPGDSVSGIDLIKLASKQHGLSYKLGFGGAAVCRLAGVGPTGDDCFEEDPDFWGYWRGDGSGGWTWASTGAGTTTVTDGGVEGWAWGSGTGPDTHPAPPATRFDDVCAPAQQPADDAEKPTKRFDDEPEPATIPPAGAGSSTGAGASNDARPGGKPQDGKRAEKRGARRPPGPRATPTPTPRAAPPTPASTPAALGPSELASDEAGPPGAGVAALIATAGLAAGGAVVARRRRRTG